jgi:peptidoglycan/LPS O-acetylase OafA/YrhL
MGVMRFILAVAVLLAHTQPLFGLKLTGQVAAVEAFFIISGFYMALVLNEKYTGVNNSYMLFISNRLMKLLPVYWLVLIMAILVSLALGYKSGGSFWLYLQPYFENWSTLDVSGKLFFILANLLVLGQDIFLFLGINTSTGSLFFTADFWSEQLPGYKFLLIPQAWSISLELMFYAIAPFMARRNIKLLVLLFGVLLTFKIVMLQNGFVNDPWSYRFFPSELIFFVTGILSYKMYKAVEQKAISKNILRMIAAALIIASVFYDRFDFAGKQTLYYVFFALAIPFVFLLTKKSKWDYRIGELSYPIYLCHVIVAYFVSKITFLTNLLGEALAVILVTVLLSAMLNKLVTLPLEKVRQRRLKQTTPVVTVS